MSLCDVGCECPSIAIIQDQFCEHGIFSRRAPPVGPIFLFCAIQNSLKNIRYQGAQSSTTKELGWRLLLSSLSLIVFDELIPKYPVFRAKIKVAAQIKPHYAGVVVNV